MHSLALGPKQPRPTIKELISKLRTIQDIGMFRKASANSSKYIFCNGLVPRNRDCYVFPCVKFPITSTKRYYWAISIAMGGNIGETGLEDRIGIRRRIRPPPTNRINLIIPPERRT